MFLVKLILNAIGLLHPLLKSERDPFALMLFCHRQKLRNCIKNPMFVVEHVRERAGDRKP